MDRSFADGSDQPDLIIPKTFDTDDLNELEKMYPSLRDFCSDDYLMISSTQTAYIYCGKRKLVMPPICDTSVRVGYRASGKPMLSYKGFKFYFESIAKPVDLICGGSVIIDSTTPSIDVIPIWAQNLELSPSLSKHVCLGTSTFLQCPRADDYALAIIDKYYGATNTGLCEPPAASHCIQEASLDINCDRVCPVFYDFPKPLSLCGNKNANYLNIYYECIPTRLPNNENPTDICSSTIPGNIIADKGMMVSPQYPTLSGTRSCTKTIEALPNKLWMIFIVDVFIEGSNDVGNCDSASLTIFDGNERIIRCGQQGPALTLISCSNIVQFNFLSTHNAIGYRGFKVYYQTIDVPAFWPCASSFNNKTTTTQRPTPSTSTLVPPSLQSKSNVIKYEFTCIEQFL
jgi:hypothetical protein